MRWRIAILVAMAIAINYLDRLTLPSVIDQMPKSMALDKQSFALLNTAFLAAYGAMYLVGGKLLDFLGTRRGFAIIIVFWSLACASHGFANGLKMLIICRLALGIGEGGGFPAATRAVAEWFPVKERSTAMGIINGATGVGGMVALPLVALLLYHTGWLGVAPWRWVFFITGGFGLVWLIWWLVDYQIPEKHRGVSAQERQYIQSGIPTATLAEPKAPLAVLFQHRETWGIVVAKFLTDAAWYFILFWLPTYLNGVYKTAHPLETTYNFSKTASVAWIPNAGAFVGCLLGGSLSSYLLRRNKSVNFSRKTALFASAIVMPLLILVPYTNNVAIVIALLTVGYFGQQSWSTLVMVLPTDLFPKCAVGTVAGLVGLGGALGGIALGQFASYLLDHGYSYRPVMLIAGLLHVTAFGVIMLTVPRMQPLVLASKARAQDTLLLVLKLQFPAIAMMVLGVAVVHVIMGGVVHTTTATPVLLSVNENYAPLLIAAAALAAVFAGLLAIAFKGWRLQGVAIACMGVALAAAVGKMYYILDAARWGKDYAFASSSIAVSLLADLILLISAGAFVVKQFRAVKTSLETKVLA